MPKRRDLTNEEKLALIRRYKERDVLGNQRDAAAELGISRGMLRNLLKNEAEIARQVSLGRSGAKRQRMGKDLYVEVALLDWFEFTKKQNLPMNGPLLRQKAEELARYAGHSEFRATEGWFNRWKHRHALSLSTSKRESTNSEQMVAGKQFFVKNESPGEPHYLSGGNTERLLGEPEILKDDDKDLKGGTPPSVEEIRQALKTLERGLVHTVFEEMEAFDRLHNSIIKHLRKKSPRKQTTIDSFFKKLN